MDNQKASEPKSRNSRRLFLKRIFLMSFFSLWTLWGMKHAFARSGKVSKALAHYQSHPDHQKMCMNCTHFLTTTRQMDKMGRNMTGMAGTDMMGHRMMDKMMGRCDVVEGPVSPMGYCRLYAPLPHG